MATLTREVEERTAQLSAEQAVQEAEYEFPYHYIPRYEGGNFSQVRKLRWGYEYLSYLRFVLARLESQEFDSLLDVGCGDGRFLRDASARFRGKRLVGVDLSARAVAYARLLSPGVEFVCGDITDGALAPIGEERFDVVTLIETLEHVAHDALGDFAAALRRLVKPGGTLVASVPSKNIKMSRKHYQHFDLASLAAALRPHFEIAEHHYLNRVSKWERLVSAALTNRYFILNDQRLLNALFRRYERSLLRAGASDCKRLCVVCKPA
ncbi:MAG: class I SAM-dependent methyltransferase [Pyrinomonadaceae bacterium]